MTNLTNQLLAALHTADRTFAENGLLASHAARQEIRAAVQAAQPEAVGWKLVPVEPDETMEAVGDMNLSCGASDVYRAMLASAPPAEPMSAPTAEPVATLWVQMETHDMGQSLAPNPPFKVAIAKAHTAAKDLPLGEYLLYATPPSAAPEPSDAERYRFLRNFNPSRYAIDLGADIININCKKDGQREMDAAIDAAIRATKGGKL